VFGFEEPNPVTGFAPQARQTNPDYLGIRRRKAVPGSEITRFGTIPVSSWTSTQRFRGIERRFCFSYILIKSVYPV
jgi:hypothetical protein